MIRTAGGIVSIKFSDRKVELNLILPFRERSHVILCTSLY